MTVLSIASRHFAAASVALCVCAVGGGLRAQPSSGAGDQTFYLPESVAQCTDQESFSTGQMEVVCTYYRTGDTIPQTHPSDAAFLRANKECEGRLLFKGTTGGLTNRVYGCGHPFKVGPFSTPDDALRSGPTSQVAGRRTFACPRETSCK